MCINIYSIFTWLDTKNIKRTNLEIEWQNYTIHLME